MKATINAKCFKCFLKESHVALPFVDKLQGRPKTTLPIVFNKDLALIQHPIRLHSIKDLTNITELAQDKKCWRGLASELKKAAEVSQTKNWDGTRP